MGFQMVKVEASLGFSDVGIVFYVKNWDYGCIFNVVGGVLLGFRFLPFNR